MNDNNQTTISALAYNKIAYYITTNIKQSYQQHQAIILRVLRASSDRRTKSIKRSYQEHQARIVPTSSNLRTNIKQSDQEHQATIRPRTSRSNYSSPTKCNPFFFPTKINHHAGRFDLPTNRINQATFPTLTIPLITGCIITPLQNPAQSRQ